MNESGKDWTRPSADAVTSLNRVLEASGSRQGSSSTPQTRKSKKKMVQSSRIGNTLDSSDPETVGDYDDGDSFIDNGSGRARSPDTAPDLASILSESKQAAKSTEQPFWVSQASDHKGDASDEEELPELGNLFAPNRGSAGKAMSSRKDESDNNTSKRRQISQRIVDSDDDE